MDEDRCSRTTGPVFNEDTGSTDVVANGTACSARKKYYSSSMNEVHVENEPTPPPRAGPRITGGAHILVVDTKTGEVVNEVKTPHYTVNERRLREELKY